MSLRGTARALPVLFRVGFAEAVAYRAEMLVWILTHTMPLVMLALWTAVARDAPVGRFGPAEFTTYFLATFVVRQVTGAWTAWEMNYEIRQGTISARLLRPVHPLATYAIEVLAALPLRLAIALPVAAIALVLVGREQLTSDPALLAMWLVSVVGAWLITFFVSASIGCLAFFVESSVRVMDLWLVLYFVFSGYLIPLELFPPALAAFADWLPFRYQIGLPVEILTGAHERAPAATLLAAQWGWIFAAGALTSVLWRRGLARYGAFGG